MRLCPTSVLPSRDGKTIYRVPNRASVSASPALLHHLIILNTSRVILILTLHLLKDKFLTRGK